MTLRRVVREHFEREAGRFPAPAGLRETVVAEATARPSVDRRPPAPAALVAVVLAVAIVVGLLASNNLRRAFTTPAAPIPSPTASTPGVLPAGHVLDVDLSGAEAGWALLESCARDTCAYSVTSSIANVWSKPVPLGPSYPATDGDAPRHIQFVTPADGFVYGHAEAFVTHDGGATWNDAGLKATEFVAITGRGAAWAVTYPCAKGTQCAYAVLRSTDGGRKWQPAAPLPDAIAPSSVAAFGTAGLLLSGFGRGDMAMTTDGGATWTVIPGNCRPDSQYTRVASADGVELWEICTPIAPPVITTGRWRSVLSVSDDGGTTWSQTGATGADSIVMESPGRHYLVLASNTAGIEVTHDSGRSWDQVPTNPQYLAIVSLGWLPSGQAWALDSRGAIWASSDRGRTWSLLAKGSG